MLSSAIFIYEVLTWTVKQVALIGILCAVLGAFIGVFTYNCNRDKDVKNDASDSAVIRTILMLG